MFTLDIFIRAATLILYAVRELYWRAIEQKANREKPKTRFLSLKGRIERIVYRSMWLFLVAQLFGFKIFSFPHSLLLQLIGFLIVITSVIVSIFARRELGVNWAHAAEHQVKRSQELVTSGIYHYIRHPIYLGLLLSFVGGEIVAESYLAIFFFFLLLAGAYNQGRREEKILLDHFGEKYLRYMRKSKMLIPYLF